MSDINTFSTTSTVSEISSVTATSPSSLQQIMKRNGRSVPFDAKKIIEAIARAGLETGEFAREEAARLAWQVVEELQAIYDGHTVPSVEQVQDIVEQVLMKSNWSVTAKAYILYREAHAKRRAEQNLRVVPESVKKLAAESRQYFKNQLAEYVYYSTYSKWLPDEGRRETWVETIGRYIDFMRENLGPVLTESEYLEIKQSMLKMEVLGSMRLLWGSGQATRATNVCAYNCSFIAPASWRDFGEIMYVLMCGTGVGFSVERQTVEQLSIIRRQVGVKLFPHTVVDSKEGWSDALVLGLTTWSQGKDIEFDYSRVRPQGARLKTMGGRASGPGPLRALLDFSRDTMLKRQGRRLTTLDVHDIICKIGEVVVMGGVRRSALISLSDLDDQEMRAAKNGQFYLTHPERSMANNSAVYNEKPVLAQFLDEWINLMKSGSGERGIFNRGGLEKQLPSRRWPMFQTDAATCGTNPCGEIILKSKQFCNLTEVVARSEDTEETLMKKVRLGTILGTYQATLTHFPYLSNDWKQHCEEEALLGVSITGQWDSPMVRNASVLQKLRDVAVATNQEYARKFGINPSTCITCVKPSGNTSQLTDASSGMHPRHASYYIRRVRIESHNPLFHMLKDMGVPYHPEVGQVDGAASTYVLEFPIAAPKGAIIKNNVTALDQLEHWKTVKINYTEHNPSVTVSVSDDEWLKVGNWVYENWDLVGGLSFLPRDNHIYQLAPYEEISEAKYQEIKLKFPEIDFSNIVAYEYDDQTEGAKELACVAGACELK